MHGCRALPLPLLLLLCAAPAVATPAESTAPPSAASAPAEALPLRSREALDAYLAQHPTPLDQLPPEARAWFLADLDFGPRGLRSFPFGELEPELTTAEIAGVGRLLLDAPLSVQGLDEAEAARLRSARQRDPGMRVTAPVAQGYAALLSAGVAREAAAAAFDRQLAAHLPIEDMQDIGTGDLRVLVRAALRIAELDPGPARIRVAIQAHDALAARGWAPPGDGRAIQSLLLRQGDLEGARAFATRHPARNLPSLPQVVDAGAIADGLPAVWTLDPAQPETVTRETADLGTRIVVVSSPGCGFSRAASAEIPRDPVLGPLFRQYAMWLAAPQHLASLAAMQQWNRRHPDAALVIATDPAHWPIALDSTPTFHFFRDGRRVATVEGWPTAGNREALVDAARSSGLLAADDAAPAH